MIGLAISAINAGCALRREPAPLRPGAWTKVLDPAGTHGVLTVGGTLEQAVYLALKLKYAARLQTLAGSEQLRPLSCGTVREQDAEACFVGRAHVEMTFDYWRRRAAARHPNALS